MPDVKPSEPGAPGTCARCSKTLSADDRVPAGDRQFCRSCYETLRAELEQAVTEMTTGINYPMATVGALLGGAAGVLLWWGFTVVTKIAFGLVAVAIGVLVARGAMLFAGGKRSLGLQILSMLVSVAGFLIASYLVNMTFINKELDSRGEAVHLGFPPTSIAQFIRVFSVGFGIMDVVFLAIVLWEAWKIPRPLRIQARQSP